MLCNPSPHKTLANAFNLDPGMPAGSLSSLYPSSGHPNLPSRLKCSLSLRLLYMSNLRRSLASVTASLLTCLRSAAHNTDLLF